MTRVLVLSGQGLHCERESADAWRAAGAEACVVHVQDLLAERQSLDDAAVLHIPGGFSFGDQLGAGLLLADRLRHGDTPSGVTVLARMQRLLARGGRILGVCNGFQTLLHLGLLPNLAGTLAREASLVENRHGELEDRWVRCGVEARRFPGLAAHATLELPVRHAQGRLVFADAELAARAEHEGLVFLRYLDVAGKPTQAYPANPNGSWAAAAGLVDPSGQVVGLMPHPEAHVSPYLHPDWPLRARRGALPDDADGLRFFRAMLADLECGERP